LRLVIAILPENRFEYLNNPVEWVLRDILVPNKTPVGTAIIIE
jgi:hypothetical protein